MTIFAASFPDPEDGGGASSAVETSEGCFLRPLGVGLGEVGGFKSA